MTRAEWLGGRDWRGMYEGLGEPGLTGRVSQRKQALFGIACCHHIWHELTDPAAYRRNWYADVRKAVEVGEHFVEGRASGQEWAAAVRLAYVAEPVMKSPEPFGLSTVDVMG